MFQHLLFPFPLHFTVLLIYKNDSIL